MDDFTIIEAINAVSLEVRNFKRSRNNKSWNWSCLVCGDSKTSTRKARFGVSLKANSSAVCHCFKCGYSDNFLSYLKLYHNHIYDTVIKSTVMHNFTPLYDLDILFDECKAKVLVHLFYIDKYSMLSTWSSAIKKKKIVLSDKNYKKLTKLHEYYWSKVRYTATT